MMKGSEWNAPPMKVAIPVMIPRITAPPRPVILPSSESASDTPMLMAAPGAQWGPAAAVPPRHGRGGDALAERRAAERVAAHRLRDPRALRGPRPGPPRRDGGRTGAVRLAHRRPSPRGVPPLRPRRG